jgi:hypothetical protein
VVPTDLGVGGTGKMKLIQNRERLGIPHGGQTLDKYVSLGKYLLERFSRK